MIYIGKTVGLSSAVSGERGGPPMHSRCSPAARAGKHVPCLRIDNLVDVKGR